MHLRPHPRSDLVVAGGLINSANSPNGAPWTPSQDHILSVSSQWIFYFHIPLKTIFSLDIVFPWHFKWWPFLHTPLSPGLKVENASSYSSLWLHDSHLPFSLTSLQLWSSLPKVTALLFFLLGLCAQCSPISLKSICFLSSLDHCRHIWRLPHPRRRKHPTSGSSTPVLFYTSL